MPGENGAQTSTQTAGETANDISNIMGGMQGQKPESKPGDNAGDKDEGSKGAADGKSGEVQHPAWMNQINSELIKDAEKAGKLSKFEKLSDLASAYLEAEGKLGSSIVKPGENASEEERRAFYKALGVPDAADKYGIEGDDAEMFRQMAFKNNLTDEQAKAIYKSLSEVGQNVMKQQQENYKAQAKATQDALMAEYGNNYPAKIEMLKRGIANYGGEAVGAKLQQAGLLADKDIVKLFILLGEQSAEGGSPARSQKSDGYKSIADGGHLSFGDDFKD
ncbi:MAG: hypothetical protein J6S67_21340 [Methanobrevibacter sp.]|nr:hypothetical protein [Methanobrevibacter sp.]